MDGAGRVQSGATPGSDATDREAKALLHTRTRERQIVAHSSEVIVEAYCRRQVAPRSLCEVSRARVRVR